MLVCSSTPTQTSYRYVHGAQGRYAWHARHRTAACSGGVAPGGAQMTLVRRASRGAPRDPGIYKPKTNIKIFSRNQEITTTTALRHLCLKVG